MAGRTFTKTSFGLVLCRRLPGKEPQALLVQGRNSHAFVDFIHGRYRTRTERVLVALLSNMTANEILDVYSCDFERMWDRIWMGSRSGMFTAKRVKFENLFTAADRGLALRALIDKIQVVGVHPWGFPKGRKDFEHETDLECALRETEEETGISPRHIQIVPGYTFTHNEQVESVTYIQKFYFAVPHSTRGASLLMGKRPYCSMKGVSGVRETRDVAWIEPSTARLISPAWIADLAKRGSRVTKLYLNGNLVPPTVMQRAPAICATTRDFRNVRAALSRRDDDPNSCVLSGVPLSVMMNFIGSSRPPSPRENAPPGLPPRENSPPGLPPPGLPPPGLPPPGLPPPGLSPPGLPPPGLPPPGLPSEQCVPLNKHCNEHVVNGLGDE